MASQLGPDDVVREPCAFAAVAEDAGSFKGESSRSAAAAPRSIRSLAA